MWAVRLSNCRYGTQQARSDSGRIFKIIIISFLVAQFLEVFNLQKQIKIVISHVFHK